MVEDKGDGGAAGARLIYADASAQLFRGVLHLTKSLGNGTIEIGAGISHPDHRAVALDDGFDMNTFLLGGMYDPVEEIPQHIGQHVFVEPEFEVAVNFIYDEAFAIYGQGKEAGCQVIDKAVQADP
jgi:hypothetical protein